MKTLTKIPILLCGLLGACSHSIVNDEPSGKQHEISSPSKSYSLGSTSSIQDLISLMNGHHPALKAANLEVRRLEKQAIVAGSLDDPKAKLMVGRLPETAAGRVKSVVGIEQKLPYPGKLSHRKKKTLKLAEAARSNREVLRLQLAYQLRVAYWRYYQAVKSRNLLLVNQQLLNQLIETVQTKVETNQAQAQDIIRLTNEVAKLEREIILLRKTEGEAKASINALLHRPAKSSLPAPRYDTKDLRVNIKSSIANHPELLRSRQMVEASQHGYQLAKLGRRPDFNVGIQYGNVDSSGIAPSANGRDQIAATFGVTVPLWEGKNKAKERAANAYVRKYQYQLESTRDLLDSERSASQEDVSAQRKLITLFRDQLIPDSQSAFDLTTNSYSNGKASFNDLVDSWRLLLQQQKLQIKNQASYGSAVARFKKATSN